VDDIADVIRSVLRPMTFLGAAAVAVLGPRREVEETAGVSLFAARLRSPAVPSGCAWRRRAPMTASVT
jgi:hypothetical protein